MEWGDGSGFISFVTERGEPCGKLSVTRYDGRYICAQHWDVIMRLELGKD